DRLPSHRSDGERLGLRARRLDRPGRLADQPGDPGPELDPSLWQHLAHIRDHQHAGRGPVHRRDLRRRVPQSGPTRALRTPGTNRRGRLASPIDPPGMDPLTQQLRSALSLGNGRVYIAYGGLFGDCGDYHGWVAAVAADATG